MDLKLRQLSTLRDIAPEAWDTLAGDGPFLKHAFLSALETSGSVGPGTAWLPSYLLVSDADGLAGAMPLFVKHDSRGEFVFDWGWADAYERSGRPYYPKLVASVPLTPATGPRLLTRPGCDTAAVGAALVRGARSVAAKVGASSLHVLFPTDAERQLLDPNAMH